MPRPIGGAVALGPQGETGKENVTLVPSMAAENRSVTAPAPSPLLPMLAEILSLRNQLVTNSQS